MSSIDVAAPAAPRSGKPVLATARKTAAPAADVVPADEKRPAEKFLPVTRFALIERLTKVDQWPDGQAKAARRFYRYLDYWRRQQYSARLLDLERAYEPFSPDTDLLLTRMYTPEERHTMQRHVVVGVEQMLQQANYVRIDPADVQLIMTRDSHYGLDLKVDLDAFDEIALYYRGATNRKDERRLLRKFLRKEEFDVPIFQRLFLLFKLRPFEDRVRVMMEKENLSYKVAARRVRRLRARLPAQVSDENIYMKLFKNLPRSDIEMVFPNTEVRIRLLDKLKLGVTGGAGLGVGAFSAAGKLALAFSNPVAAAGAVVGLGGIVFRQAMNFMNQRQRYMVVMAQNLYFHSLADNRGVMIKLADRAAEEDVKEEFLLYSVLAKETVYRQDIHAVDRAIEAYLLEAFGLKLDFDVMDALSRLIADGIVSEQTDGRLVTLPPVAAAAHVDRLWDGLLDDLVDDEPEGEEMDKTAGDEKLRPGSIAAGATA